MYLDIESRAGVDRHLETQPVFEIWTQKWLGLIFLHPEVITSITSWKEY